MSETDSNAAAQEGKQQFAIQKIYVKDISFEAPAAPKVFTEEWDPKHNLELNTQARALSDGVYEVVLSLTVTATNGEKTGFLVEVQQCGIFTLGGFSEQDLSAMLGSYCPTILFPYAREAVSDLVTRGGFPPLLLAPVNFDALYAQHLKDRGQQGQGNA